MMVTMVEEEYEREQYIRVEILELFDMLYTNLRMKWDKIRVHYNVQENETKFHCHLREYMDSLNVKIETPD